MLTEENYQLAWNIYIVASVVLVALFWWLIRAIRWPDFKAFLCLSLAALLLTPVAADPEQAFLAPAFLVCILETLFEGTEFAARAGVPLFVGWLATAIVAIAGSIIYRIYRAFSARKSSDQEPSEQASA